MNKKPTSYLQINPKWRDLRYPCDGGTMSIGGGGCGPTSAAMMIATLADPSVTPVQAMQWGCLHHYVFANQGTAYDYFRPMLARYGIECDIVSWTPCLNPKSTIREKVIKMLQDGYYFIVLMKKGNWTNGGHYVVLWWSDGKVRILDPASTRNDRLNGDHNAFWSTAKYFWWVDARAFNNKPNPKEEEEMAESRLNTMTEIQKAASWAVPTIQKLCKMGGIKGSGTAKDAEGYPTDMNLSLDMIRMFVVNDKMGLYKG